MNRCIKQVNVYSPHGAKVAIDGIDLWLKTGITGIEVCDCAVENRLVATVPPDWVIVLVWP